MDESIPKLTLTPLSASKIKQFESCSLLYYCNAILKIPQPQNRGAQQGSCIHDIFQLLILPKHRKQYDLIILNKSLIGSPAVTRLMKIYIKKYNLPSTQEMFDILDSMSMVGLNTDFIVKGGELIAPEYKFEILNQNPLYLIKGFIDKIFKKGKKIIIDDYKSSKKKFEGEDDESNLQALIYSLAAKKIWPELESEVRFIFLQFASDPIMKMKFTDQQLRGLEYYLEDIQKRLDNFTEKDAYKNLAYDKGFVNDGSFQGRLLCGMGKKEGQLKKDGSLVWSCPYKYAKDYYVILKNNKIIKSSLTPIQTKEGEIIEKRHYNGCPRFQNNIPESNKFIDTSKILENFL